MRRDAAGCNVTDGTDVGGNTGMAGYFNWVTAKNSNDGALVQAPHSFGNNSGYDIYYGCYDEIGAVGTGNHEQFEGIHFNSGSRAVQYLRRTVHQGLRSCRCGRVRLERRRYGRELYDKIRETLRSAKHGPKNRVWASTFLPGISPKNGELDGMDGKTSPRMFLKELQTLD